MQGLHKRRNTKLCSIHTLSNQDPLGITWAKLKHNFAQTDFVDVNCTREPKRIPITHTCHTILGSGLSRRGKEGKIEYIQCRRLAWVPKVEALGSSLHFAMEHNCVLLLAKHPIHVVQTYTSAVPC
jgi:hypothetical protein